VILLESKVNSSQLDQKTVSKFNQAGQQKRANRNRASVPQAGIVSAFDPDQRGFLTPALQGFTAIQTARTGTIALNPDTGVTSYYQNPDNIATGVTVNVEAGTVDTFPIVRKFPYAGGRQIRPQPGQPVLFYQAASGSDSALSTNYMRGGKADPYRDYPSYPIRRFVHGEYISGSGISSLIYRRTDADFAVDANTWDSNSPLPPGWRWVEMTDILYENTGGIPGGPQNPGDLITEADLAAMYHIPIEEIEGLLPQDQDGRLMRNARPLSGGLWALHPSILGNDAYWTGQVRNPEDWDDPYWYGNNNLVDKEGLSAYLQAHPGCRFV
jgi:hypothetical protein